MFCICGSFQCSCQGKCTCTADDCKCERCFELRSSRPLASCGFADEISPTRGTRSLVENLQISYRKNIPVTLNDPNLLHPERTSCATPRSPQSTKDISAQSSPDSPKNYSPKRKLTSTNEQSLTPDKKRYSPCKNNQRDTLPKIPQMGACSSYAENSSCSKRTEADESSVCPPYTKKTSPGKSVKFDKSDQSGENSNASTPPEVKPDPGTIQDTLLSLKEPLFSPNPIDSSSESKNDGHSADKQFASAQYSRNRKLPQISHKESIHKAESSERKFTNFQSDAEKSYKQILPASSEGSRLNSRSLGAASASTSLASDMQSIVKCRSSDTIESSQQTFSEQPFSSSEKPYPSPPGNVDVNRPETFQDLSQIWFPDEENENPSVLTGGNLGSAGPSTTSATGPERETTNRSVTNAERPYFERSDSEISTASETQIVPDPK